MNLYKLFISQDPFLFLASIFLSNMYVDFFCLVV